ncbi:hypothetical protein HMPREF9344_02617 [Cutibacterium acnes HL097PA1]|nr:hypothetical protein [Cutibacterium acnes]EGE71773.1 hypothetical protein HMPREF9344_02617 [Cutibacterium acnes HL097PA1]REB14537.1 hypothetical protein COH13_04370 [Cutibacterium acnes]REB18183.1 hypothetical protein COH12_00005 [Cutibacterium acnes]
MMALLFPDVYASGVSRSVRHEAHLCGRMSAWQILPPLIMVDLAEAVEARAATDGPVSLADAAVGPLSPVTVVATMSVAGETAGVAGLMTASHGAMAGVAGTMIVNHSAKVTQTVVGVMTVTLVETISVVEIFVRIGGTTRISTTVAVTFGRMGAATAIAMIARSITLPSNPPKRRRPVNRWLHWTSMRKLFRHRCVLSCVVSQPTPLTSLRVIWLLLLNFSTRTRLRQMPTLRPLVDAPRVCPSCAKWLPRPHIRRASMPLPSMTTVRFDV